jgi:peptide/nickel transport system substrate-binding protein
MEQKRFLRQLALIIALLAVAATAGTVLALPEGRVPPLVPTGDPPRADQAPAQATVPYTTLVEVNNGAPVTLDPHWMYDTASHGVAGQVYETLLMHERENPVAWIPVLATAWEASADGQIYTFTVRSGVTFHEGGTLQAHDVAYSFWRGLLQDRVDGPAWMLFDPLLGVYDVDSLPGDDLARCQAVKDAITFDDTARTVSFHLSKPFAPFLDILATSLGSVLDQEWMAANGDWDGSCTNWRDWYNPAPDDTLLYDAMNGTGPFHFESWVPSEIRLVRYDDYWRVEPAWPLGPAGPAELELLVFKTITDWPTRRDMLLNGQADIINVPATNASEIDPYLWGMYDGYTDNEPSLIDAENGTVRLFKNLPTMSQTPVQFNYAINPDDNPFIGSGLLDGDGIPTDFFADLHVRKAFNYAMDWTQIISDIYNGEAVRSLGPIPRGMMGYDPAQPTYDYSPTLATQEFQLAFGGQVWTQGFSLTIAYNEGNTTRQRMAELLKENIEALHAGFHLEVISMPWDDFLSYRHAHRMPIYVGGWLQDYHHPHNWVHPFLHSAGTYAGEQNFPPAMAALFDAKVDACIALADSVSAETCYRELQNLSYQYTAAMWGVQPLGRHYECTEVRGYYFNPAVVPTPYYAMSKGAPPIVETVSATADNAADLAFTTGATATLEVPAGAVSETSEILFTPDVVVEESHPGGFRLGGRTFDLQVCQGGECIDDYTFDGPVTFTLHYMDADVWGLIENELYLYTWDGNAWVDAVVDCGWSLTAYGRYPDDNLLVVPLCHFSRFGLVGGTHKIYLPLVMRRH